MTAIEDVVATTGVDSALKKDSLLYVTYDSADSKIEFKYTRFGDDYNLATKDKTLFTDSTSFKDYKLSDLYPVVSKNYTYSTVPPAIVMSAYLTENNLYRAEFLPTEAPMKFLRLSNGMNTFQQALSISIFFSVAQGDSEMKWEKVHRVAANETASSGVTVAKTAVGDFNGDGYVNDIAVVTNVPDQWKYYLYVYQVSWKNTAIK